MLSLVDFQVKLKRRETSNCCQGEIIQKKFKKNNNKKKTGWSRQIWKGFAATPREEKRLYNGQLYENLWNFVYLIF